jgi:outer membrane protein OmpA-like peptidoglycan-associated protein
MSLRHYATMLGCSSALALAVAGCASTPPPRELADARQSYHRAHVGPARELVPAQVFAAQQALDRAEQAFMNEPDAQRTRDLAYIAQRRAEIAEAQAQLATDYRDKARAEDDLRRLQVTAHARAQSELSQTRQEVASQRQELASQRRMLATQERQLTAEQRARREAEQRASAAIASLEKIALVKEEARGMVITLNGSVLFATGESTLLPIAKDRLHEVALALIDNPGGGIVVEGHTDAIGSQSRNEDLSRRRAESVRDYLVTQGIEVNRITAIGLGPNRPIADNTTPEGRANNRRVEIVVQRDSSAP